MLAPALAFAASSLIQDERWDTLVDPSIDYVATYTPIEWVVGGAYRKSPKIPAGIKIDRSNNNLALGYHEGRLYFAWRTAPIHFASEKALMHIVSSRDFGQSWVHEHTIRLGRDVREPFFISYKGDLYFYYLELGKNFRKFEPRQTWVIRRQGEKQWSRPKPWGKPGEIAWEFKVRRDQVWVSSYTGNHYSTNDSKMEVELKVSSDGQTWTPHDLPVYRGGVSEVGFEFDEENNLWAVTRNEDGDSSGFGSHVAFADIDRYWRWQIPAKSNPRRYDSPRMFRHGDDLYLIARRDVGGVFGNGWQNKLVRWYKYWRRPKRTALYRIDRQKREVVHLFDFPSAGDTSFPSILRTGPHSYLIANYTSPLKFPGRSWMWGQVSPQGTQIYFTTLHFAPKNK